MTTITQRLNEANDVNALAEMIYRSINPIISDLVTKGIFVDNGIAVIPYETIDMTDPKQAEETQQWETNFVFKAHYLAYRRWVEEFHQ